MFLRQKGVDDAVDDAAEPIRRTRDEIVGLPRVVEADQVAPKDARELSKLFFDRLQTLEEGSPDYLYARNTLIEMNLSLVHYVAGRFRNRGNGQLEDIVQVGMVGLIKAIDRFDVRRGFEFVSFAVPCILGEIKRHFRDTSWAVHVPRRLKELRTELVKSREQLFAALGREPTVRELAEDLSVTEEQVLEVIVAANGYAAGSLDSRHGGSEDGTTHKNNRSLADVMGEPDPAIEVIENIHALAPLLAELDERERRIIEMRFGQEMTQAEIGSVMGISQMHVSRLLAKTLARLRAGMLAHE
ncbi:SigB/SigF/SigG family RNA polymerase sigma factor [Streptomyces sp. SID335]|nr:SigB/SigF/SigG family RNA polymerase sigma factor [Streptomyces sp. SID335]MYZ13739.1 SigB/SigF/SigG family RNA polymerase sigma factor [Streptomyces sp. SID337]NDZ90034.1 SigB/SigF/SigG family RNA polymerase sigma factor [Streptomyces sp. SID10115]NEA00543.1 SigB/SigF/SigG family RNA polymerase sigma factor [Streptomyces sp. SID10116]NEB42890.1 SigB/SigF/SigG family RNA polymerase sigma factor [Streptomyces sp. SID339]